MTSRKLTLSENELLFELRKLTSQQLHEKLVSEASREREHLSEIVCHIYEIDRRKLYLKFNYSCLLDYLTSEMKYSKSSAMRRLDAARLLAQAPELAADLASGKLTLTQLSVVAHGLKQAKRETRKLEGERRQGQGGQTREGQGLLEFGSQGETGSAAELNVQKRKPVEISELLDRVKGNSAAETQFVVARTLNLEIKAFERKVVQRDESLRLEMTFSKDEAELLKEVKDILSHAMPGASFKEVIVASLKELRKRKNPAALKRTDVMRLAEPKSAAAIRRAVFRKDKCCQWEFEH
jgi:hypothetical protein